MHKVYQVRHRIDGLESYGNALPVVNCVGHGGGGFEKKLKLWQAVSKVRHRIDGLEKQHERQHQRQLVRHRIDGLETNQ